MHIEQASEIGTVCEFIYTGEDRQSDFFGSIFHATTQSICNFFYFPATTACVVIGTATHLHSIERDDYNDNRYVN